MKINIKRFSSENPNSNSIEQFDVKHNNTILESLQEIKKIGKITLLALDVAAKQEFVEAVL